MDEFYKAGGGDPLSRHFQLLGWYRKAVREVVETLVSLLGKRFLVENCLVFIGLRVSIRGGQILLEKLRW